MIKKINPSIIKGSLNAPASKSYAQRALAASLLAKGTTILRNPSRSDDALSAMKVIGQLGARVEDYEDRLIIHGGLKPSADILNFGESGLGIRLFASIVSLLGQKMILTGEGSLKTRPMEIIADALKSAGVQCKTHNGFLPVSVTGPLPGGEIEIDGSISSQVLSGLIMALPLAKQDSIIRVKNLKSTPYVDMTLEVMDHFCIKKARKEYEIFQIPGRQFYHPTEFSIEGDWSGAAFLLVAAALTGEIEVTGLNPESSQADKVILDALKQAGAKLSITKDKICCAQPDGNLTSFFMDATDCPDLFPPLAALAAHCDGISIIRGVHRLIHKESNRAQALLDEMRKLGVSIHIHQDEMIIEGPSNIQSALVDSHNDHRMAMAAVVTALPGKAVVSLENPECVNKSYPDFYRDIKSIGGILDE